MFDHEAAPGPIATWPVTLAAEVPDQRRQDEGQEVAAAAAIQVPAAEAAPVAEVAVASVAPPPPPPVAPRPPVAETSDDPKRIMLGSVEGTLYRMPIGVVHGVLGKDAVDRVELLQEHPSILPLQLRMRATDGRCAPVFMIETGETSPPDLFSGVESIAAARNLGLPLISVVTVAPEQAGALQHWIATNQGEQANAKADDEVLIFEAFR